MITTIVTTTMITTTMTTTIPGTITESDVKSIAAMRSQGCGTAAPSLWNSVWTTHGAQVDNPAPSTELHRRHPRAGDHGGQPRATIRTLYAGATACFPQSTTPVTTANSIYHLDGERFAL